MRRSTVYWLALLFLSAAPLAAQEEPPFDHAADVIYGRKFGMALTMDVFAPGEGANGAAAIAVISGGWFSAHEAIRPDSFDDLLGRGYTVFAVVHGSQPRFTIPDCIADMNRAVRFIRHHAADYEVDPDRIGIYGLSAGGHLSLMQGTAGDDGKADAQDPIERQSSRVQAVAAFFPPTDFLNYGKTGELALGCGVLHGFKAPFAFEELDPELNQFVRISDLTKVLDIGRRISPIQHVSSDDPPTLLIHGDADELVPIQQAETIVERFEEAGVTAELVVKPGAGHGWPKLGEDLKLVGEWFDNHLAKEE
jgi:acetyl esterase/lipase